MFSDEERLKKIRIENKGFYLEIRRSLWIFERTILVEWSEIEASWK